MDDVQQKMLIDLGEAVVATLISFGIGWGDPQKQAVTTLIVASVTLGSAFYNNWKTKQIVAKTEALAYHAGLTANLKEQMG